METMKSRVVTPAALKAIADRWRDHYGAERVLLYGSGELSWGQVLFCA